MTYSLASATLTVASFGAKFDPTTEQPPTVLALNLDGAEEIQEVLSLCVQEWESATDATSEAAMAAAVNYVAEELTRRLGATYELQSSASTYTPVYYGTTLIGHDTATWVVANGAYLFTETTTDPKIGMYGCILLAIRQEVPVAGS